MPPSINFDAKTTKKNKSLVLASSEFNQQNNDQKNQQKNRIKKKQNGLKLFFNVRIITKKYNGAIKINKGNSVPGILGKPNVNKSTKKLKKLKLNALCLCTKNNLQNSDTNTKEKFDIFCK